VAIVNFVVYWAIALKLPMQVAKENEENKEIFLAF